MSNNYDYISVSTDSELMENYNKVMPEMANSDLKIQMPRAADYSFDELVGAIRQICKESSTIYELVNKQIENTRTLETIAKKRRRKPKLIDFVIRPEKLG